jgi:hypothetical protein
MKKKAKLFQAFLGDAAGLRDVLVAHFRQEADRIAVNQDATSENWMNAGQKAAYSEAARFLKKLVINGAEHVEDEPAKEDVK